MIRKLQLNWRKAKALSVLQNAYEMPLREPLNGLDDTDLRIVTKIAYDTGGNAFDAAASFMTLRVKSAFEANIRLGYRISYNEDDVSKLAIGLTRTRSMMAFYRLHMDTVSEIAVLRKQIAVRDDASPPPPADPPATS